MKNFILLKYLMISFEMFAYKEKQCDFGILLYFHSDWEPQK